jgi:hypothetical protein
MRFRYRDAPPARNKQAREIVHGAPKTPNAGAKKNPASRRGFQSWCV